MFIVRWYQKAIRILYSLPIKYMHVSVWYHNLSKSYNVTEHLLFCVWTSLMKSVILRSYQLLNTCFLTETGMSVLASYPQRLALIFPKIIFQNGSEIMKLVTVNIQLETIARFWNHSYVGHLQISGIYKHNYWFWVTC